MSSEAISWAFGQAVETSSLKLTLVTLAFYHHHQRGDAWASAATLAKASCQNIKTVERNIVELARLGLITDTGQREGRTKSVKVYGLSLEAPPKTAVLPEAPPKTEELTEAPPKTEVPLKQPEAPPETGELSSPYLGGAILQQDTSLDTLDTHRAREAPAFELEVQAVDLFPETVIDARMAFDQWNILAAKCGLPIAKALTEPRRKKINALIETYGLIEWTEVFAAVERSPILKGQGDIDWRADLDWLTKPANFLKVMEGSYDGRKGNGSATNRRGDARDGRSSIVRAADNGIANLRSKIADLDAEIDRRKGEG